MSLNQKAASTIPLERLENYLTPLLAFLMQTSADMDELLHDSLSSACETSVAESLLPSTLATLRPWHGLVAILCGRFMEYLLKQFDAHLRSEVSRMRSALPPITACFSGKTFLEEQAKGVLCGTVPATRKAHNELHRVMSAISVAGRKLGMSLALDIHDVTKSAVAIARAALQEGKDAVVYAEGAEALMDWQTSKGVEKAKAVVEKHSKKFAHLEQSFWDQVKETSNYGGNSLGTQDAKKEEAPAATFTLASMSSTSSGVASSPSPRCASVASGGSRPKTMAPPSSKGKRSEAPRAKKGLKRASEMMEDA